MPKKHTTSTSRLRSPGAIPAPAAGDWLGIVIFLAIAIVSILGKLQESKKKNGEEEWPDSPSIEPEDLPEPIRRMLYGDRDRPVPTAKPAQSTESKRAKAESVPAPTPAPVRRPTPRPVTVAPPPAKPRQMQFPVAQQTATPQTPRPAAPRIPGDDETRPRMQPLIQKPTPPVPPKVAVPPPPKPAAPTMVKPPEAGQLIKAARAADASVRPIANPWLFKDKADLRRAIVLSEILAPPLALREMQ